MTASDEFLEADGRGGFASGTEGGPRTRRYHALLLSAEPDGTRFVLVNGLDAEVETAAGRFLLSAQDYAGAPAAREPYLEGFTAAAADGADPGPRWTYALPDGTRIERALFVRHGEAQVFLSWRLLGEKAAAAARPVRLFLRPFLSGRDYHALHHENPAFRFEPAARGEALWFRPYEGVPGIVVESNGTYRHDPHWYRRFHYAEEAARGLDSEEDLAAPGVFGFDLVEGEAVLVLRRASESTAAPERAGGTAREALARARHEEGKRRAALGPPLQQAGDAYIIDRAGGKTIIAGYPWFTDWGRDTFIALRGLALATGRLDDARAILLRWAGAVSEGMLPNRFPDRGAAPEYNSVDAALWFVVAVFEYLEAVGAGKATNGADRARLVAAVEEILAGHAAGTRYRIGVDDDGLLRAGEVGVQLTWMDAKIGDWVVTPRIGKPVEIEALWLNALAAGERLGTPSAARWRALGQRARASFAARFWNPTVGYLNDVVDVDHRPGVVDVELRPNQIFAVGGLPLSLIDGPQARAVVDAVEAALLTPLGLRSLAPGAPAYRGRYQGTMRERDSAYHQGTVWPWLLGPFVEAWVRVRGGGAEVRDAARARFLPPLVRHLAVAGVGHVSEVADGDPPHTPGGCPFQAWSVGELLRLELAVLGPDRT